MESLSFPKFQLLSGWCVFDSAGGTSPKPWRRKRPLSSWKSSLESSPQWHGKWPAPPMSFGFNDFFGFPLEAEKTSGISIYKTSFLWIIVDDAILNLLIWAMAMLPRNTESFFDKCLSFRVFIWFPTDSLSPELLMHFRENFQNFPSNLCGKLLGFVQLSTLWKRFFSSTWDQVFLATKKNQKVDFEIASLWCWSLVANFFCVSPSHQISLNKWQIPPSVPQESHLVPSPQKMGWFNLRISRVKGPSQTTTDSLPMALAALYSGTCSCPTGNPKSKNCPELMGEVFFSRKLTKMFRRNFWEEMTLGEARGLDETWQLHGSQPGCLESQGPMSPLLCLA